MASYEEFLETWAAEHGSDGCTHSSDLFYRVCCLEHDFSYIHGETPRGVKVTKAQADQRFRDCIQAHSRLRFLSPMSWWRWVAVSRFGRGVWAKSPPQGLMGLGPALAEAHAARDAMLNEARP
jgi:hypothetical protein